MSDNYLPKSRVLKSDADFSAAVRNGGRFHGTCLRIFYRKNSAEYARAGISVGRKYGKAIMRNRFKRCVREAFRHSKYMLPPIDMVITPLRKPAEPAVKTCLDDFMHLQQRLKAYND